jgi:hypothetical protein
MALALGPLAATESDSGDTGFHLDSSSSAIPVPIPLPESENGSRSGGDGIDREVIDLIQAGWSPGSLTLLQLQYAQTVLLNFNGLLWAHVSVPTLKVTSG